MIAKPDPYLRPNTTLETKEEFEQLEKICFNFTKPYRLHGLRNFRQLYKIIRNLEYKNLIKRKGYYFNPTKYGWIAYLNHKEHFKNEQKQPQQKQTKLTPKHQSNTTTPNIP